MSNITTPAVRGVPAFFVQKRLTGDLTWLGVALALLGVIDLFFALANFGLGEPLTALIDLVLGAVEVAAAALILGKWKTTAEMRDLMSTACMGAMWLTAVSAAIDFVQVFGAQVIIAVFGVALAVLFMMVLGSASAVLKSMATHTN